MFLVAAFVLLVNIITAVLLGHGHDHHNHGGNHSHGGVTLPNHHHALMGMLQSSC